MLLSWHIHGLLSTYQLLSSNSASSSVKLRGSEKGRVRYFLTFHVQTMEDINQIRLTTLDLYVFVTCQMRQEVRGNYMDTLKEGNIYYIVLELAHFNKGKFWWV